MYEELRRPAESRRLFGFTLIELLVVVAVIGILAGLLLPALAKAKEKGFQAQCTSGYKQMGLAIQMYADDHEDQLPGPVFAGGYISYDNTAGSKKHLVNLISTYLGYPAPSSKTIIASVLHCPSHRRFLKGAPPVNVRCFLLNDNVSPDPGPKIFPFGYPIPSPDYPEPQKPLRTTSISQYASPDSVWAASDGDWEMLLSLNITNFSWASEFPVTPPHGRTRNQLFFDGHVEATR